MIDKLNNTFFTGYFTIDGIAAQKIHCREDYDDPVIGQDYGECEFEYDGYVSNVGRKITIHIKKELMTGGNIGNVINWFLSTSETVESIEVVTLHG